MNRSSNPGAPVSTLRPVRFSIAGLMGTVLVASFGLAALRADSLVWAGLMSMLTCGVLLLAVAGAICRTGARRAWWLGFALFGWSYLLFANRGGFQFPFLHHYFNFPDMPTVQLMEILEPHIKAARRVQNDGVDCYMEVGQDLWAILAASFGGLLARVLFGAPASSEEEPGEVRRSAGPVRRPWGRVALVAAAGYLAVGALSLGAAALAPPYAAGAMLIGTWGLIGLAGVGAICSQGRRRAAWLGAAVFGAGSMLLIFETEPAWGNSPRVAVDSFLTDARLWIGSVVTLPGDRLSGANERIWKALEMPVPMRYPKETPLEDVLKDIKNATAGPNDDGIPIYVNPIGLQEVEKTIFSPVTLDLEGVPLKVTLTVALSQLGLKYRVVDGLLHITAHEDYYLPVSVDPILTFGHCFLALVAAGLGGVLGPLVCGARVICTDDRAEGAHRRLPNVGAGLDDKGSLTYPNSGGCSIPGPDA